MDNSKEQICELMEQVLKKYKVSFIKEQDGEWLKIKLQDPNIGEILVKDGYAELCVDLMPVKSFVELITQSQFKLKMLVDWKKENVVILKRDNSSEILREWLKPLDDLFSPNLRTTRIKKKS